MAVQEAEGPLVEGRDVAVSTIQPVYVEPVTIGMKSQLIIVGDL